MDSIAFNLVQTFLRYCNTILDSLEFGLLSTKITSNFELYISMTNHHEKSCEPTRAFWTKVPSLDHSNDPAY